MSEVSCTTGSHIGFMRELRYENVGGGGLNLITEDMTKICRWCERNERVEQLVEGDEETTGRKRRKS